LNPIPEQFVRNKMSWLCRGLDANQRSHDQLISLLCH